MTYCSYYGKYLLSSVSYPKTLSSLSIKISHKIHPEILRKTLYTTKKQVR